MLDINRTSVTVKLNRVVESIRNSSNISAAHIEIVSNSDITKNPKTRMIAHDSDGFGYRIFAYQNGFILFLDGWHEKEKAKTQHNYGTWMHLIDYSLNEDLEGQEKQVIQVFDTIASLLSDFDICEEDIRPLYLLCYLYKQMVKSIPEDEPSYTNSSSQNPTPF
jgi:hypothetical protein